MVKKIAIPTTNGELSAHFGHCEKFAVYTVENDKIVDAEVIPPPAHEHGSHPSFLREIGCETIISGGMGEKAQALCEEYHIELFIGIPDIPLEDLVIKYIAGELQSGVNLCDH
ncbi:MAG: ATPase [Candidatus Cloacimonetes bacterium HGW-Cloacimonetes-1]|jgi:predicted Fe-Mo cluster-binding NifX family protein|nr:MAG: ATPase [Candidatus Cloacimonetes bacterium HGW-Cloacimonetes-1]